MTVNDVPKFARVPGAFAPYLVERLKNESITLNDVSKLTTVVAPFVPYLVQATCSVPGATLHNRTSTTLNAKDLLLQNRKQSNDFWAMRCPPTP